MFKKKKTEEVVTQTGGQEESTMPAAQPPQQVYTMPDKYMPAHSAAELETKGKGKVFWVILIILVALLIAAGSAAYVFISTGTTFGSLTETSTATQVQAAPQQVSGTVADTTVVEEDEDTEAEVDDTEATPSSVFPTTGVDQDVETADEEDDTTPSTTTSSSSTDATVSTTTTAPQAFTLADQELALTTDRDKDGLTDIEEALYGTTVTSPDSDSDGFLDSRELLGLYSPAAANTTLLQSGLVLTYTDPNLGWSIYYPASWFPESLSSATNEVLFTPDTVAGEFIEVLFEEKLATETVEDWLTETYPTLTEDDLTATTVGEFDGVILPDGITHYLDAGEYLIGITYNAGTKEAVSFKTTFQMMVNSFEYIPAPTTSSTTTDNTSDQTAGSDETADEDTISTN